MYSVCLYSYSLEGLSGGPEEMRGRTAQGPRILEPLRMPRQDSDDRGSLVSLTEEQEELGEHGRLHDLVSQHTPTGSHKHTQPYRVCPLDVISAYFRTLDPEGSS